jgi:hypothetical protein
MRKLLIALALSLISITGWAAGTCVVSDVTSSQNASSHVPDSETVIVKLVCTGDAATGSFPATTVPLTGVYPSGSLLNAYNLTGYILYSVGRTPGTTQPTASYTVTIKDVQGFALDQALLTTNGNATTAQLTAMSPTTAPYPVYPVVRSALTVAITANIVNSAQITLDLIFRTRP